MKPFGEVCTKTEIALRDEICHLTNIVNSYFSKGGTTHKEKIQWIKKQIEFKSEDNCEMRDNLRDGLRHVKALKIILRRCEG